MLGFGEEFVRGNLSLHSGGSGFEMVSHYLAHFEEHDSKFSGF
jgi:hypothetical protein